MLTRMHELKRVMIVGAGTMGSQIALQTALSGRYGVTLVDTVAGQLDKARAQNQKLLDRSVEKGRLTKDQAEQALRRIDHSSDLPESASNADLVIEAVIEDIDIAVQKGLNWPMGPFHLLDFSGLDVFYGAMQDRHRLGEGGEAPEVLRRLVEEGRLGRKTGKGFFDYD